MKLKLASGHWPPGGWQYYDPKTGYRETKPTEHDRKEAAQAILQMRRNNPHIYPPETLSLELSLEALENYTVQRLANQGLMQFVMSDTPVVLLPEPVKKKLFTSRNPAVARPAANPVKDSWWDKVQKIVGGVSTLSDWVGHGQKPVDQATAEQRASVCVQCPLNKTEGIMGAITGGIAAAIKAQTELRNHLELHTQHDDKLLTCSACACPLPLKVWTPLQFISDHLERDVYIELDQNCWILKEL
jgi:hypothetical protein